MPVNRQINQFQAAAGASERIAKSALRNTGIFSGGLDNLSSIIFSQGRTDPRALGLQLVDATRRGEASKEGVRTALRRRGLSGFVGGLGLEAAIDASVGRDRQSILAADAREAENRKRADLGLMELLLDPIFEIENNRLGLDQRNRDRRDQKKAAQLAALSSLTGGFISAYAGRGRS